MILSARAAAALAQVKSGRGETQIAMFDRNGEDMASLVLQGETLANAMRVLQHIEGPGIVKPQAMSKAIARKYGGWRAFCQLVKSGGYGAHQRPNSDVANISSPRPAGILDQRVAPGRAEWSVK